MQRYIWTKDGMIPNAKGEWVKATITPKKKVANAKKTKR